MPTDEGCAVNLDGTLKPANEIEWLHSPTQESVQLPHAESNGHSLPMQALTANPQLPTRNASGQQPPQPGTKKNPRKRK